MSSQSYTGSDALWPPRRPRKKPKTHPFADITNLHTQGILSSPEDASDVPSDGPSLLSTPSHSPIPFPLLRKSTASSHPVSTPCKSRYANGFKKKTKPCRSLASPYDTTRRRGSKRLLPLYTDNDDSARIRPHPGLTGEEWQQLVEAEGSLLPPGAQLREFQIKCANAVLSQSGDIVVIAPTGAGKSLIWHLPLLAQRESISLVITPYTSLELEGEARSLAHGPSFTSVFIHSQQKSSDLLLRVAKGEYRVIYICPEMLDTITFAAVFKSTPFQNRLPALYIDEGHLVKESATY